MGRLAQRLHSVFDTRDEPALALRVRHPLEARWEIQDGVLTVYAGETSVQYILDDWTIRDLASALEQAGFEVPHVAFGHLSATILRDGNGDQSRSDGDHITAATSVLSVLLGSQEPEYRDARAAIANALAQLRLPEARSDWLELFGSIFGVARLRGMTDAEYAQHIVQDIQRLRSNAFSLRQNILQQTGQQVMVDEPWRYVAKHNESRFSGSSRFFRGDRWGQNLIQLWAPDPIDWEGAQAIAQQDRAAGNLLIDPDWRPLARHVEADPQWSAGITRSRVHSFYIAGIWHPIWDVTRWGEYEVARNYLISAAMWLTQFFDGAIKAPAIEIHGFCRGDAIWSEDTALGGINTRFPGGSYFEAIGATVRSSDTAAFSDYVATRRRVPICEWTEDRFAGTETSLEGLTPLVTREVVHGWSMPLSVGDLLADRWDGAWDGRHWESSMPLDRKPSITPRYSIRTCSQSASADVVMFSDTGALSDYEDEIVCNEVEFDRLVGATFIDPFTNATVSVPALAEPPEFGDLERTCTQQASAQSAFLSGGVAFSDYVDGWSCSVIVKKDPATEDTVKVQQPVCAQRDGALTVAFSGEASLSDYIDGWDCDLAWVWVPGPQPPASEVREVGQAPTWSHAQALSDYTHDAWLRRDVNLPAQV